MAGASGTPGVPFGVEYWPYGLRRAAGRLDLFHSQVAERFSRTIDIKMSIEAGRDGAYLAPDIARVADDLTGPRSHTDLPSPEH